LFDSKYQNRAFILDLAGREKRSAKQQEKKRAECNYPRKKADREANKVVLFASYWKTSLSHNSGANDPAISTNSGGLDGFAVLHGRTLKTSQHSVLHKSDVCSLRWTHGGSSQKIHGSGEKVNSGDLK
jgi:hypothetical protein